MSKEERHSILRHVRLGSDGETNSLDGVNSTERAALLRKRIARIGQRIRSGRSPTSLPETGLWLIWEGVWTPILFLPEKTRQNGEPDRLPYETLRMREPAVSPTRLAVAIATRNSAFLVLFRKEASAKGSKGGPDKYLSKSHGGEWCNGRGAEISKERTRSLRIVEDEISGRQNLNRRKHRSVAFNRRYSSLHCLEEKGQKFHYLRNCQLRTISTVLLFSHNTQWLGSLSKDKGSS